MIGEEELYPIRLPNGVRLYEDDIAFLTRMKEDGVMLGIGTDGVWYEYPHIINMPMTPRFNMLERAEFIEPDDSSKLLYKISDKGKWFFNRLDNTNE